MLLQHSRRRVSRLLLVNRLSARFRSTTPEDFKELRENEIETDNCDLGESHTEQNQNTVADEAPFPLNSLPADLLVLVIEQLVVAYLSGPESDPTEPPSTPRARILYPKKCCWNLHTILSLRLVNRTWAKEILLSLHNNIILPNLSMSLNARLLPCTSPSIPHRRTLFASALYNSTLSISNRRIGDTLPKRIISCANHALSLSPPPPFPKKEILKRLCTAASQKTTYGRVRLLAPIAQFPKSNMRCYPGLTNARARNYLPQLNGVVPRDGTPDDELVATYICTLIILDMEDHAIELLDAAAVLYPSDTFGCADRVARNWGRKKVLDWFKREDDAEKVTVGGNYMRDAEWLKLEARSHREFSDNLLSDEVHVQREIPHWAERQVLPVEWA
ncbi:uncharacterized protein CC84DRAFT_1260246 [Paraphaeosphaeria sporulosa]|uniref:Uncharacterized protein n=1 Tax=Paraphaeosphaeria sporulosa TaxID=1460663 RepID=A0A177CBB8_9PLEO|nr:uncharacterized protein CC84DRAFT_1260246 [Paraphaeosphaeria sporulosa]OAG04973.1 hypothetical protein CC84DRAFT_1260246 [Paraphaeosphaeria sporulosa]